MSISPFSGSAAFYLVVYPLNYDFNFSCRLVLRWLVVFCCCAAGRATPKNRTKETTKQVGVAELFPEKDCTRVRLLDADYEQNVVDCYVRVVVSTSLMLVPHSLST